MVKNIFLAYSILLFSLKFYAQTSVDINLNVKHTVDNISEFDRSKFIVIHANQTEQEWDGDNFTTDLRNDFLNGYDVYLGRDTGGITWNLNQMAQDPTRPGFVNPSEISSKGAISKINFSNKINLHQYEERKNATIAGQLHPFWTGTDQEPTKQGWYLANATATGEYMGRYINEFHGGIGQKIPSYVEIINEPAYESLDGKNDYSNSLQEIADFHNEVADAIRVQAPDLKIGGYTTAFPDFEVGDFKRWENRWKLFMDVAGQKMDFWSIHLYDFGSIRNGEKELRSGSNVEATFDMMEHYSKLSFNKVKPIVISEYGAQTHDYNNDTWSPYRDWLHIKASSSLLMSFLERPNTIASAINFIIVKAEWGFNSSLNVPYASRLMRKENEPSSYTGQWVYTDMVKFFQLWKNVKGTRIDTTTDDLDIQVDAYVDGNKGYVILNSLNFESTNINLNVFDNYNVNVTNILKRHLKLSGNSPVLEEETITSAISSVELGAEATMILEYTFDSAITIDETSNEVKYYAETYYKPIIANQSNTFAINNIQKNTYGEAVLRIGVGREHGKSLKPTVIINGETITVPNDWRGYDQAERAQFFGVLEIPVSFSDLQANNNISVSFGDTGGHISSVTMQVFNFSDDIRSFDPSKLPSNNFKIKSTSATCIDSDNGEIEISAVKNLVYKALVTGPNYSKSFDFTSSLSLDKLKKGVYSIEITLPEYPTYKTNFSVEIIEPDALAVASKQDSTKNNVTLKLSGSKTYFIKINGVTQQTNASEIVLPLQKGVNKITVFTDQDCQGIYEEVFNLDNVILVYPNPNKNQFSLTIPFDYIASKLFINNSIGSLVYEENISKINNSISVDQLKQGIYFVKLVKEGKPELYSKLIIK